MKKLLSFLLITILLSACSLSKKQEPTPIVETPAPVQRDTTYNCNQIKDPTTKAECVSRVENIVLNMLIKEIQATKDAARCDMLPSAWKDGCRASVGAQ